MAVVYLAVIFLVFVAVLWNFPRLRLVGGITGAVLVAVVTGLVLFNQNADQVQKNRITAGDLRLEGLTFDSNGRSYSLAGRVQNGSENYELRDMTLRVRIYDCPRADSEISACETIGEDEGIARAQVPPGQVRAFSSIFYFPGLPEVRGELRWVDEIVSARALEERR